MVNKCVYLYQYKTVCYFGLVYFSIFASKTYLNPPCEGSRGRVLAKLKYTFSLVIIRQK